MCNEEWVEKPVFKKRLSESKLLNHLGLWQKYNDGIRCRIITVKREFEQTNRYISNGRTSIRRPCKYSQFQQT